MRYFSSASLGMYFMSSLAGSCAAHPVTNFACILLDSAPPMNPAAPAKAELSSTFFIEDENFTSLPAR